MFYTFFNFFINFYIFENGDLYQITFKRMNIAGNSCIPKRLTHKFIFFLFLIICKISLGILIIFLIIFIYISLWFPINKSYFLAVLFELSIRDDRMSFFFDLHVIICIHEISNIIANWQRLRKKSTVIFIFIRRIFDLTIQTWRWILFLKGTSKNKNFILC